MVFTYAIDGLNLDPLLGPHLKQDGEVLVVGFCLRKVVERLNEHLADVEVLGAAQQVLAGIGKLGVNVSRKHGTGVLGEDAEEHDGVVLPGSSLVVFLAHEFADEACAFGGGSGGGLGGLDDGRKEEDFIALVAVLAWLLKESSRS